MNTADAAENVWFLYFFGMLCLAVTGLQLWTNKSMEKGGPVFLREDRPFSYWFNITLTFGLGTFAIGIIARQLVTLPGYLPAFGVWVLVTCGLAAMAKKPLANTLHARSAKPIQIEFLPAANPTQATLIAVRGWSRPELEKALTDFLKCYELLNSRSVNLNAMPDDTYVITFPNGIAASTMLFLVNYLQYPKGIKLKGRSIGVVGRVILTDDYRLPNPDLAGQHATIYIPAGDTDYDLVYIKVASGKTFKISFTDEVWQGVPEARISLANIGLM